MNEQELFNQVERANEKDIELANSILEKNVSLQRYLVSTMTVVLGILVSLHDSHSESIQTGLLFALSVVLLSLSILLLGVCLYSEIYSLRKARILHVEESRRAYRENRRQESVMVPKVKTFVFCEAVGHISFALALLALCGYVLFPILVRFV